MRKVTIIKGITCFLLTASLVFELFPSMVINAETLTNDFIKESEAEKQKAEQNKSNLNAGLSNIQNLLKGLESAKGDLENYITELDSELENINRNKDYLNERIGAKEKEVATTKEALQEATEVADRQYATMKKRIKYMYERGSATNIELLLKSSSFADFLNKAEFIQRLSHYDRIMLEQYIETKEKVASESEQLMLEQAELEDAKKALENEEQAMEALIADKEEEIGIFEADITNKEAAVNEYKAMIAAQDAMIKELESAILAEKKRLIEENRKAIVYDGGQFAWPAPSYKRISDDYGNRIHPTLGIQQFHNGLDMAAPGGSPILAAYDGEVVAASYSPTMGNYIMIDHGDGLLTIYMHASSLSVGQGATVARGEQIGCVGSTGRSTGNHLHFSVRLNGSYVSPWNYLG